MSHVTQRRAIQAEETAKDPAMGAKYTSMRTAWLELSEQRKKNLDLRPESGWYTRSQSIMNDYTDFSFYSECSGKPQLLGFQQRCDVI